MISGPDGCIMAVIQVRRPSHERDASSVGLWARSECPSPKAPRQLWRPHALREAICRQVATRIFNARERARPWGALASLALRGHALRPPLARTTEGEPNRTVMWPSRRLSTAAGDSANS
jgi:hypothetical protein